jgi:hypothetical protein
MIDAHLLESLHRLCEYAQAAGAPAAWITQTADRISDALLMLNRTDPRRRRSLAKAAQMANALMAMRQAGYTHGAAVAALCKRHRLGKSQVYNLLKMFPGT